MWGGERKKREVRRGERKKGRGGEERGEEDRGGVERGEEEGEVWRGERKKGEVWDRMQHGNRERWKRQVDGVEGEMRGVCVRERGM